MKEPKDLTKGKRTYRVGFYYTEYCSSDVKANSPREAEKKLHDYLEYYGLDDLNYDCYDRDYMSQDAELIK